MRRILLLTIKCRYCNKQWCITENDKEYLKGCPFCTKDITKPISNDIAVDSFENAIHKTLAVNGLDILKNRSMFISYLMDVGYDYRKEVKILSNAIDQKTFNDFFNILQNPTNELQSEMTRIAFSLVENEGIAENWANRICQAFVSNSNTSDVGYEVLSSPISDNVEITPEEVEMLISDEENTLQMGDIVRYGDLEWCVLDESFGRALIICKHDFIGSFHNKDFNVSWENCDLRANLNSEFIRKHFTQDEEKYILSLPINSCYGWKGEENLQTQDRVFCLSVEEVSKYKDIVENMSDYYSQFLLRDSDDKHGQIFVKTIQDRASINNWGVYASYKCKYKPAMWVYSCKLKIKE